MSPLALYVPSHVSVRARWLEDSFQVIPSEGEKRREKEEKKEGMERQDAYGPLNRACFLIPPPFYLLLTFQPSISIELVNTSLVSSIEIHFHASILRIHWPPPHSSF